MAPFSPSNAASSSAESQEATAEQRKELRTADYVAKMQIASPEVLRVTPAHMALCRFGKAFRGTEEKLFHKSKRSQEIERFWSHSWHGNSWAKVLTLFVLYNGLPAVVLGTLAAAVMMVLFGLGVLPGFNRTSGLSDAESSVWSLCAGLLVYAIVLVQWRPQQRVFFDRVCISEDDPGLKAKAIRSLAGILRNSKQMLVLWDQSWSTRLWCLFELAAFLKCKKAKSEHVLIVRPTLVGPCSIAVFTTVSAGMLGVLTFPVLASSPDRRFWAAASLLPLAGFAVCFSAMFVAAFVYLRRYYHSIHTFVEKLRSGHFDEVTCSCCQLNHVDKQGQRIPCDREVVKRCVATWFGSIAAFEEFINEEVVDVVARELRQGVFTRSWALQVGAPLLWGCMDIAAIFFRYRHWGISFDFAATGIIVWVLVVPLVLELTTFLIRRFCSSSRTCCSTMSGLFCQLATFFLIGLFVLIILAAWAWPKFLIDDDLVGDPDLVIGLWSCAFLGQVLLMAGLVILMEWLVGKSKLERRPVLDSISHSCGPGNDLEIEEQDLEETVPADRVEITL